MDTTKRPLSGPQRLFADYLISGIKPSVAFRRTYRNGTPSATTVAREANRIARLPHIAAYIAAALAERRSDVLLTRDKKRLILGDIAQSEQAAPMARIAAVRADNEMTGDNAPVRVEGEITLFAVFQSLTRSTGLPTSAEVKEMGDAPALLPAMERAQ